MLSVLGFRLGSVMRCAFEVVFFTHNWQLEPVTFPLSTKETRKYESSYEEIDGIVG